jgi:transposase
LTSGLFWLKNRRVTERRAGTDVPRRSHEQRLRALDQANDVRTARAALKKQLASGKVELAQILADPPPLLRTAPVRDLLLTLPKIGPVKAARILAHCGIAHSKTLAGLSERQRGELINLFRT